MYKFHRFGIFHQKVGQNYVKVVVWAWQTTGFFWQFCIMRISHFGKKSTGKSFILNVEHNSLMTIYQNVWNPKPHAGRYICPSLVSLTSWNSSIPTLANRNLHTIKNKEAKLNKKAKLTNITKASNLSFPRNRFGPRSYIRSNTYSSFLTSAKLEKSKQCIGLTSTQPVETFNLVMFHLFHRFARPDQP